LSTPLSLWADQRNAAKGKTALDQANAQTLRTAWASDQQVLHGLSSLVEADSDRARIGNESFNSTRNGQNNIRWWLTGRDQLTLLR
jgi:hypothetical protein